MVGYVDHADLGCKYNHYGNILYMQNLISGYDYLTFYPKTNQFYNFYSPTVAYFLYPPFFHIRGR